MERKLKETVYTPDSDLLNVRRLFSAMKDDLMASRELAWRLFVRNISAQYRQSLLGYFWAFVPPLITTLVWVFLSSQKVLDVGDTGMPYPLFVLTGTIFWQTFAEAVESPLKIVGESRVMLAKINFPREALVLAGVGQVLFNFLIRLSLLALALVWFQAQIPITILLVPLGVGALLILGLTVGILLTPVGMLYQDVGRAITVGLQVWFFLTPVIYPMPQASWANTLVGLNPVTPLLQSTRDWMLLGHGDQLPGFIWVTGSSLILLLGGWVLYRIAMPHLIARMSS